jgi:hypothetical protein
MSEKKGKVIHVNNLIIHAKNVEIVRPEHVKIDQGKHIEHNQGDHVQGRDPWGFFWGRPTGEEVNEQELGRENPDFVESRNDQNRF